MNRELVLAIVASCCVLASTASAQADIIATSTPFLYTVPDTLGPYDMTPFPADPRPVHEFVTDVPSPLGGAVDFSLSLYHTEWYSSAYWYPPADCYIATDSVTLTLPEDTRAFSFYVGIDTGAVQELTITADDETSIEVMIESTYWPVYVGFYVDDPEETISTVTVPFTFSGEVGVFTIAAPEPSTLCLLAPLLLAGRRRSARRCS